MLILEQLNSSMVNFMLTYEIRVQFGQLGLSKISVRIGIGSSKQNLL